MTAPRNANTASIREKRWTASNLLSASRMVLAVPAVLLTWFDYRWAAFAICIIGSITDILDGHLARRNNEITEFGKVIDPLADKVFVGGMVVVMMLMDLIPVWLVVVVLGRDLLILLGGLLVERRTGTVLPSNYPGKAAVVSLSIALLLVLLRLPHDLIQIFTWLALVLLALSLTLYAARAYRVLRTARA